jgi:hypothetical protein
MVSCRIAIQNLFVQDSRPQTPREVIDALRTTFPGEWTDSTIRAHLIGLSTNHPSAHHYPHLQTFAFLNADIGRTIRARNRRDRKTRRTRNSAARAEATQATTASRGPRKPNVAHDRAH